MLHGGRVASAAGARVPPRRRQVLQIAQLMVLIQLARGFRDAKSRETNAINARLKGIGTQGIQGTVWIGTLENDTGFGMLRKQ
jgi:hypothetical protein